MLSQLMDGRAHEPWSAVCLDPNYQQVSGVAVVHPNQSVGLAMAPGLTDADERSDPGAREAAKHVLHRYRTHFF